MKLNHRKLLVKLVRPWSWALLLSSLSLSVHLGGECGRAMSLSLLCVGLDCRHSFICKHFWRTLYYIKGKANSVLDMNMQVSTIVKIDCMEKSSTSLFIFRIYLEEVERGRHGERDLPCALSLPRRLPCPELFQGKLGARQQLSLHATVPTQEDSSF